MTPILLDFARKSGFTLCKEESALREMLEQFAKFIIEHEAAKWYPYGSLDDVTRDLKAEVEASNKMHAELLGLKVAAQQALEVLNWLLKEDPWAKPDVIGVRNAIRRGLEQPTDLPPDFINALKFDVAIRDTANEPVAWATAVGSHSHVSWGKDRPDYPTRYEVPLYTTPPAAQQEPVAWMHVQGNYEEPSIRQLDDFELDRGWQQYPLYVAPRQWVGLTNKDIIEMWPETSTVGWDDIRLIEAKLKEKNT